MVAVTASPLLVFAQEMLPTGPQSVNQLINIVCTVTRWLFTLFILLAIIFIILAAYKYLTAGGAPEKVKGASQMLIYAVVAIVIAVLARGIPFIVGTLVSAQISSIPGGC